MFTYNTSISSNLRSVVILGTSVSIITPPFDDGMGAEVWGEGGNSFCQWGICEENEWFSNSHSPALEVRGCKRVDYPEYYEHLL